jgi:hypothetical protein
MCRAFSGEDTLRGALFGAARAQFAQAANAQPMRAYWVRILRGTVVEQQFEALAADSLACATDHSPPEGCRVLVIPLEEWREQQASKAGDLTPEDLDAIDREFGIDRRNLARAVDRRVMSRGTA